MGVPKFFRYISERYPCLSDLIYENQIPDIDNLYLDMNGIIHNCSHPNDSDIHFRITEEQIFKDIFHYLEFIFNLIKPQKLFFMAVDGVAPRAKMNQQRCRRFRSAKDAEMLEQKARERGETLPTEQRFDSNCITPGTVFMDRLNNALRYFVKSKISNDERWRHCTVILSGHDTPGEGEHKIMEYIRYLKVQPDFNPETRHCLYGLDADLIMLGLCTHERHFSLLREEVKFGKDSAQPVIVDEKKFYLLHLGLMREYLEMEFNTLKENLPFVFNIENIIDDWIFLVFLVGNDFIPHLPLLHINQNALPIIMDTYKSCIVNLDGYININGKLNLKRLQEFFLKLAEFEKSQFIENYNDLTYNQPTLKLEEPRHKSSTSSDLLDLIKRTEEMDLDDDFEDPIEQEFFIHKRDYYNNKLHIENLSPDMMSKPGQDYIEALQWTLDYYYCGCQSWGWYYPHHYAPFISDLTYIENYQFDFKLGKPFTPFQQLLSVLPAASRSLLPPPYRKLMTNVDSEIIDYYPSNFETDLNGKTQEWEAVVLIPFIEERRLLKAMAPCDKELSAEQKARNSHGPMLKYNYSSTSCGLSEGVDGLPPLVNTYCVTREIHPHEVIIPRNKLIFGPSKGYNYNIYYPGFPTFKHLKYTSSLMKNGVQVFNMPSRNDNMIIKLNDVCDFESQIYDVIGTTIYANWPNLTKSKVTAVSTEYAEIRSRTNMTPNSNWDKNKEIIIEHNKKRLGIDVGEVKYIVHAKTFNGYDYVLNKNRYELIEKWSAKETFYPAQAIVSNLVTPKTQLSFALELTDILKHNKTVIMLAKPYYGSLGVIENLSGRNEFTQVKVTLSVEENPEFSKAIELRETIHKNYLSSYAAAKDVNMSKAVFNRITGSLLVVVAPGGKIRENDSDSQRINIGLQFKLVKVNEEKIGYCKKQNNIWYFSAKALAAIETYRKTFPKLFDNLNKVSSANFFYESDLFGNNTNGERVKEVQNWLKKQEFWTAPRKSCDSDIIESEVVHEVLNSVAKNKLKNNTVLKKVVVKPEELYVPGLNMATGVIAPEKNFLMFDRVVVAKAHHGAPYGATGTIIGIITNKEVNPLKQENIDKKNMFYIVLFDHKVNEDDILKLNETRGRVAQLPEASLFCISQERISAAELQENLKKGQALLDNFFKKKDSGMISYTPAQTECKATRDDFKKFLLKCNLPLSMIPEVITTEDGQAMMEKMKKQNEIIQKSMEKKSPKSSENKQQGGHILPGQIGAFMEYWKHKKHVPAQSSSPKLPKNATEAMRQMLNIGAEDKKSKHSPQKYYTTNTQQAPSSCILPKPPMNWCTDTENNKGKAQEQEQENEQRKVLHQRNQNNVVMVPFYQNVRPPPFPPPSAAPHGVPNLYVGAFPVNRGMPTLDRFPAPFQEIKPTPQRPVFSAPRGQPIHPLPVQQPHNYHQQIYRPQQSAPFNNQRQYNYQQGPPARFPQWSYQIQMSDQNWRETRAGHGAFVPLQAEIKATKMKQQAPPHSNTFVQTNLQNRNQIEIQQEAASRSFVQFLSNNGNESTETATKTVNSTSTPKEVEADNTITNAPVAKIEEKSVLDTVSNVPKPRISRIAAKFTNL